MGFEKATVDGQIKLAPNLITLTERSKQSTGKGGKN